MQILEDDYRLEFGNSFAEDLNTHSTLSHIYCYWFPQTPLTTIYVEQDWLFLSAAGEYFEGSEVTPVLCAIITEALQEKAKTAKKKPENGLSRHSMWKVGIAPTGFRVQTGPWEPKVL